MAKPTTELIIALRKTISRLQSGSPYQWGHMGSCNCGHLAQELTNLTKAQIHEFAMQRSGDWNDQAHDYCPDSGLQIDAIIETMLSAGLTLTDISQLEKLSNSAVLSQISADKLPLAQNNRSDVILYMNSWLKLLEEEWALRINLYDTSETEVGKSI